MTTSGTVLATSIAQHWHNFWRGEIGDWILNRGLRIVMLLIAAVLAARFVTWLANRVTRRLDLGFTESDALVRSEATKHRQAVASVISWVSIVLIYVVVVYEVIDVLPVPVGALVGPAAVLGAALGFGAQRLVQDLLAGFFIIVEKQYGFGDLVELSMVGSPENAAGTVEDVTLRVTKLRSSEGEVFTVPNGNIVKSVNLSKDWARAVVDIPVPTSADLGRVNGSCIRSVSTRATTRCWESCCWMSPRSWAWSASKWTPSPCDWWPAPYPASSSRRAGSCGCW